MTFIGIIQRDDESADEFNALDLMTTSLEKRKRLELFVHEFARKITLFFLCLIRARRQVFETIERYVANLFFFLRCAPHADAENEKEKNGWVCGMEWA